MTPEERAKHAMGTVRGMREAHCLDDEVLEDIIAGAIRAAEGVMSKYWDMTVGQERDELRAENNNLRALLAYGTDPCIYCGLQAEDLPKCSSGFPGCARADDMMLIDNPWPTEIRNEGN